MSELDIAERRVPQDGRFRVTLQGPASIDFRVSIMPIDSRRRRGASRPRQRVDEREVSQARRSTSSGLTKTICASFRRYIKEPYGMVLVTGPTGSR